MWPLLLISGALVGLFFVANKNEPPNLVIGALNRVNQNSVPLFDTAGNSIGSLSKNEIVTVVAVGGAGIPSPLNPGNNVRFIGIRRQNGQLGLVSETALSGNLNAKLL